MSSSIKEDDYHHVICDDESNIAEIEDCIKGLKNNQIPGNDGLTS